MEIRVAKPGELTSLSAFYHKIWHETQAPYQHPDIAKFRDVRFMQARIDEFYPNIIVAVEAANIIGLIVAHDSRISQLFIDKEFRRQKLGEKLLALGEAKLAAEGTIIASLNCLTGNENARRFYERNGWHVERELKKTGQTHKGDVAINVWEMMKRLAIY
ncbi:N-acetyltransferase family protein [Maritalea sp.]|uniref:GNAT family N-acetyltransferase n=1 Tax=Maritalea sp. TaxID=2003361 RepID=UPI003EF8532A